MIEIKNSLLTGTIQLDSDKDVANLVKMNHRLEVLREVFK